MSTPLVGVVGARKTGKTYWAKSQVRRARRLLVWDPIGGVEFGWDDMGTVFDDRVKLADYLAGRSTFAAVFHPGNVSTYARMFKWFCRVAWDLKHLTLVVDELADVTTPRSAPDEWKDITRKGANHGIATFGITQLPGEVDGTFLGNTTFLHCRRCNTSASVDRMADLLRLPPSDVAALTGREFFERNMETGAVRRVPPRPPTHVRT